VDFLLAIGLITRIAALIQVPILFGAIFFVHMQQGLFSRQQDLEFVILVLFLLLMFAVYGGGRLSVDYVLEKRRNRNSYSGL
jgi:putative oxidoreductase